MEFLNVLVAGTASFVAGGIWYMTFSKQWVKAVGMEVDENGRPKGNGGMMPMVVAFVVAIIVAGMMRHMFALSGIETVGKGAVAGFGIGLFLITPWLVMCYGFAMRPRSLMVIDGAYATLACAITGAVLNLF